jgi:superfamily I DNA and RNA helicase
MLIKILKAAKERTELAKQRNVYLQRMAGQQLEITLAQRLITQQEALVKARDTLRALSSENDYDSDSEPAKEAKMMIDFWTKKRDETMADAKCHSNKVASKPMQRLMPQNEPEIDDIGSSNSNSSSSDSSSTDSSLGSMSSEKEKPFKKRKPLVQKKT